MEEAAGPLDVAAGADEDTSAGFPPRLMFLLFSGRLEIFANSLVHTLYSIFLFNKLRLSVDDWLYFKFIFGSIVHFSSPIGGFITDVITNKFYLIVFSYTMGEVGTVLFLLLALPQFRRDSDTIWYLLYGKYSFKSVGKIISYSGNEVFLMDQFGIPEEQGLLRTFIQYRNILNDIFQLVALLVSPFLKSSVPCFGEQDCYIIPFSIHTVLIVISHIVVYAGYKYFLIKKPVFKKVAKVFPCMGYGFFYWLKDRKKKRLGHMMDYAEPKYGPELVEDAKSLIRIFLCHISLPILVGIASNVNIKEHILHIRVKLRLGSYKLMPEHIHFLYPLFRLIIWPVMMRFVEPRFRGKSADRPLRWLLFGGLLTSIYYFYCGFIFSRIVRDFPVVPEPNESQLRIYNGVDCDIFITSSKFFDETLKVGIHSQFTDKHIPTSGYQTYQITIQGACIDTVYAESFLEGGASVSVFIQKKAKIASATTYYETVSRATESSLPYLIILGADAEDRIEIVDPRDARVAVLPHTMELAGKTMASDHPREIEVLPSRYKLYKNGVKIKEFETDLGGIYHILLSGETCKLSMIATPNTVHFAHIIPVIIFQILADYFIQIGTVEFVYMETPRELRGVTLAMISVLSGFGSLLIPAFNTRYRLDLEFYGYSIINLLAQAFLLSFAFNLRSRHPNRRLI